jgi:hypothetical protein
MAINRIVRVSTLLAFDGTEFIDQAYSRILGRAPDESGRDHFLRELRSGKSKHAILQILADSPEGVNAGMELDERYRGPGRLARIPVLGRIGSFISDLIRMPSTVIELQRQLNAALAMRVHLESLDAIMRAEFASLEAAIRTRADESVHRQGEHSRQICRQVEQLNEQFGALYSFAQTELVQSTTISYLTSFIDVRQNRLSTQLANARQITSEELRQFIERLSQGIEGRLTAHNETLNGVLATLHGLQNRIVSTTDDVFRSQVGTKVDQLSTAAAEYLNWAAGHTGYSAQKDVWINHPFGALHAKGDVTLGYINERILEVPYVFARAMKLPIGSRILDCGCCESWVGPALAQFGYNVIGVDVRPYPIPAPNFTFVRAAMEEWDGPAQPIDAILSLSSLEHFGLGAYGGPQSGEYTDRALLAKMAGWLKPSGLLILTAPYGHWSIDEFQRVYDSAALEQLLSGWDIEEAYYFYTLDGAIWRQGNKGLDTHAFPTPGRAVVLLQARRAA